MLLHGDGEVAEVQCAERAVDQPRTREERCYDTHHVHVRSRYAREIYQALRAMADQGQVVRIRDPLLRTVSWAPLRPPRFVEELEACLALPCFTRVEDRQLGAD